MQHYNILYVVLFIITYFLISLVGIIYIHTKGLRNPDHVATNAGMMKNVLWFIPVVNIFMLLLTVIKTFMKLK